MVRPVAPVVPSPPISNARYREETRRHPTVLDIIRRPLLREKSGRRVVLRIGNGLQCQICAVVLCEETPSRSALWRPRVLSENTHRDIKISAGSRDNVFSPFRREGHRRDETKNQDSEQAARAHAASPVRLEIIERVNFRPKHGPLRLDGKERKRAGHGISGNMTQPIKLELEISFRRRLCVPRT